jgi:DNA-3-methyladenine glycosylase
MRCSRRSRITPKRTRPKVSTSKTLSSRQERRGAAKSAAIAPPSSKELSKLVTPLSAEFYLHPPDIVGRALLGKLLIRRIGETILSGLIVETEAYFGQDDAAAHSFAGPTSRNQVLFGPPGRAYVYFIYGMHYCLNISCEPEGHAGSVLLRALEPVQGLAAMAKFRKQPADGPARLLTSGPGRLCQALGINREGINGVNLTDPQSDLVVADGNFAPTRIAVTERIGIRKASHLPLRFFIAGNRFVSASRAFMASE